MGVLEELDMKRMALVVGIVLAIAIFLFFIPVESHPIDFPAQIYVSDQQNFVDIKNKENNTNALDFGGVSPGYKVEKFIKLNIGADSPPAKVSFRSEGDIKKFLELPSSFVIKEPKEVSVYANIPKGTAPGTYSGKVTVKYSLTVWRKFLNLF